MERLYAISSSARWLGMSERFLRRKIAEGRVEVVRLGRAIRLPERELLRLSRDGIQTHDAVPEHGRPLDPTAAKAPFPKCRPRGHSGSPEVSDDQGETFSEVSDHPEETFPEVSDHAPRKRTDHSMP